MLGAGRGASTLLELACHVDHLGDVEMLVTDIVLAVDDIEIGSAGAEINLEIGIRSCPYLPCSGETLGGFAPFVVRLGHRYGHDLDFALGDQLGHGYVGIEAYAGHVAVAAVRVVEKYYHHFGRVVHEITLRSVTAGIWERRSRLTHKGVAQHLSLLLETGFLGFADALVGGHGLGKGEIQLIDPHLGCVAVESAFGYRGYEHLILGLLLELLHEGVNAGNRACRVGIGHEGEVYTHLFGHFLLGREGLGHFAEVPEMVSQIVATGLECRYGVRYDRIREVCAGLIGCRLGTTTQGNSCEHQQGNKEISDFHTLL